MKYKAIKGSGHGCCFNATVVDLTQPTIIGGEHWKNSDGEPEYEPVCECFDMEQAQIICDALNGAAVGKSVEEPK